DTMRRTDADPAGLCHGGGCPMGGLAGRLGQRPGYHTLANRLAERRDARGTGLVSKYPVGARLHEALLPAPDTGLRSAGHAHDLVGASPPRRKQDDLRPPDVLLRAVPI